jgi:hypothetical protein
MSDPVRIALIIAVVVVIALFIFRRQLSSFLFKATKDGIEAELKTHTQSAPGAAGDSPAGRPKSAGVNIKRNRLFGWGNRIDVEGADVNVEENTQLGGNQEITAKSDRRPRKKK